MMSRQWIKIIDAYEDAAKGGPPAGDPIKCGVAVLHRDGMILAQASMRVGIAAIDEQFGDGYAAKHPELIAAFMQSTALNSAAPIVGAQIASALDHLTDMLYEWSKRH